MRFAVLYPLAVVLGTSAGLGLTWYEFSTAHDYFNTRELLSGTAFKPLPKVVVEGSDQYDFGSRQHQESGEHVFVVRNEGSALLELTFLSYSCGQCVQTSFEKAAVQPGQSVEVPVKYHTRKEAPQFSERVELGTNDPAKEVLALQIRGYVTKAIRVSVPRLVLGNVSANEPTTAKFQVFGYFSAQLKVVGHQFQNPETASFFSLESRPLEPAAYADEKHASVAEEVTVAVKSGLPLGPINQTIQLEVQAKEKHTFEIPIDGTVVSDITLVGNSRLDSENNVLRMGPVKRSEGAKAELRVLVKGPTPGQRSTDGWRSRSERHLAGDDWPAQQDRRGSHFAVPAHDRGCQGRTRDQPVGHGSRPVRTRGDQHNTSTGEAGDSSHSLRH